MYRASCVFDQVLSKQLYLQEFLASFGMNILVNEEAVRSAKLRSKSLPWCICIYFTYKTIPCTDLPIPLMGM